MKVVGTASHNSSRQLAEVQEMFFLRAKVRREEDTRDHTHRDRDLRCRVDLLAIQPRHALTLINLGPIYPQPAEV